ncbi:glycosyltransferase family 90 protein [Serendipita vermifera MAFF 305830]|uniref:Glycosyltransferase family 90 protein n=1 Tax=Serendipita vermifera MAFF 305830 TaxID=933852 RepID=A0A0C3BT80_SERVB|nr:glycosyltransferase family 90 protein [Serendipita vermifera MAFF 305830]
MLARASRRHLLTIGLLIGLLILYKARYRSGSEYDDILDDFEQAEPSGRFNDFTPYKYPPPVRKPRPQHRRISNGLVETNMEGRHPLVDLIDKAASTWKNRLASQTETFREAVKEYTRRYGRPPPKGFNHWWRFAKEKRVILIDEFDQINHNIEPYFALSPATFAARVDELANDLPFSFSIEIKDGKLTLGGERAAESRAQDIKALVEPIAQWLPDLKMYASDHDKGNIVLGQDQYDAALELASEGLYFTDEQLREYESLNRNHFSKSKTACHPYSNAILGPPPDENSTHTFLADPLASMNYCSDPSLLKLHGSWAFDHAHQTKLVPMWVHCKWIQDHSFLLPAMPGFDDIIRDPSKVVPWSQRKDNRLFWRARSTGVDFHTGWDWHAAHRIRLHFHAKNKTGEVELLQEAGPGWAATGNEQHTDLFLKSYSREEVVNKYLDVGLVGPLVQCSEPPPFCDNVTQEIEFLPVVPQSRGQDAKMQLDIDGNGWSQRYARLLSTGSVIFKSTVFPEWNTNWLVPYYHYVPIKVDYTDLFDTMAFFAGWPDGTPGHDHLAERIGMNGVKFVQDHWRWEDAQAYTFRLLLEYARLASPDREAASYHG